MKIGILTYHRSNNYGALLQAIALRKVLSDMGHEVTFIDYWPAYHRRMYALFSLHWMMSRKGLMGKIKYMRTCIKNHFYMKERKCKFDKFIINKIEPYVSSTDETYDIIVHGSDQIWRKQPEIGTYNPFYFGNHSIAAKKKISYAASMGRISHDESDKLKLKDYFAHLDSISVREKDLKNFVEGMGFPCIQHIDPTLLLSGEKWIELMNIQTRKIEKKYVLYYNLIPNSFDDERVKAFAETKGLELKTLYSKASRKNSYKDITTADPLDFLNLIYNAEFVLTSSYHGLVFSILFKKQFYASFRNNAGRAESLLAQLSISDRLLQSQSQIPLDNVQINYMTVTKHLDELRTSSLSYLQNI